MHACQYWRYIISFSQNAVMFRVHWGDGVFVKLNPGNTETLQLNLFAHHVACAQLLRVRHRCPCSVPLQWSTWLQYSHVTDGAVRGLWGATKGWAADADTADGGLWVTRIAIVSFSWPQLRARRARQKAGNARRKECPELGQRLPLPSAPQQLASYARQHQQATNGLDCECRWPTPLCRHSPLLTVITGLKHPACPMFAKKTVLSA